MAKRTTPRMSASEFERFETRHTKGAGCWLWRSKGRRNGYGVMSVGGRSHPAHRLSFVYHRTPIPHGMLVLHSCDVRACVNPTHLRIGSAKDNADDRTKRGRWGGPTKGAPRGTVTLAPEAVPKES